MKNSQQLSQKHLLGQRLLPQQMRYVELLERNADELEAEIEKELEENPALERAEIPVSAEPDERRYYNPAPYGGGRGNGYDDDFRPQIREGEPSLTDHLYSQLADLTELPPRLLPVARFIIGALDSNGYLTRTPAQLLDDITLQSDGRLSPTMDEMSEALRAIRSLDPPGVAASDLRDCLLQQLLRLDDNSDARSDAVEIIRHYFDLYSHRNIRRLSAASGLTSERIDAAHRLITSLNPKPGAAYAADPVQSVGTSAVNPDIEIDTDGERLSVSLTNSLPRLRIEQSFLPGATSSAENAFIRDRRNQADTFIDLLERRADTLMRIARAIANIQAPFFLNGDDESLIRPMVLRQVAQASGLELSVVSRAVTGKWIATQWGVYPLKYFFNHRGAETESAADLSSHSIMAHLRRLIDNEDKDHPLSDEALADALTELGMPAARRTVTKYRDRLAIPSARLRRR